LPEGERINRPTTDDGPSVAVGGEASVESLEGAGPIPPNLLGQDDVVDPQPAAENPILPPPEPSVAQAEANNAVANSQQERSISPGPSEQEANESESNGSVTYDLEANNSNSREYAPIASSLSSIVSAARRSPQTPPSPHSARTTSSPCSSATVGVNACAFDHRSSSTSNARQSPPSSPTESTQNSSFSDQNGVDSGVFASTSTEGNGGSATRDGSLSSLPEGNPHQNSDDSETDDSGTGSLNACSKRTKDRRMTKSSINLKRPARGKSPDGDADGTSANKVTKNC